MAEDWKYKPISLITSYLLLYFVFNGIQRLSGLLFFTTIESLRISRRYAALPFIINHSVANIVGSLCEILCGKHSPSYATVWGVFLTFIGIGFCFLTTNVPWLMLNWGLIFGAGFGFVSLHLSKQLQKLNCSASSLCSIASSLGCVFFPLLFDVLEFYYGPHGSFLLLSGIVLNCFPFSLAAIYNVHFHMPDIKWRIRKKNKNYAVTDCESRGIFHSHFNAKKVTNESFKGYLEPEMLRKVTCIEDIYERDITQRSDKCAATDKEIIFNHSNDKKDNFLTKVETNFEADVIGVFSDSRKLSEAITNVRNCGKQRNLFEESFRSVDKVPDEKEIEINKMKGEKLEEKIKCINAEEQGENPDQLYNSQKESSEKRSEKRSSSSNNSRTSDSKVINIDEKNSIHSLLNKLNQLDFKIHVVECTFADQTEWFETVNKKQMIPNNSGYRKHSNSLPLECYDDIDFTSKKFQTGIFSSRRKHESHLHVLPDIYSISECDEREDRKRTEVNKIDPTLLQKPKQILKTLSKLATPTCLCLIFAWIIYEICFLSLIIIFADLAKDIEQQPLDFKWILVAFGMGGVVGGFCFRRLSERILENSYVIQTVLFALNGLTTASILWSDNYIWLIVLYFILGCLENGMSTTFPNLIVEYTNLDTQTILTSAKNISSGIAVLCIPCMIGFSRDYIGDYELLLQMISCFYVLGSFLCYFLPRLSRTTKQSRKEET